MNVIVHCGANKPGDPTETVADRMDTAQLSPGAYEISSHIARDAIDVRPLNDSSVVDVRGGARIVIKN
jgi:hypothetical protein